MNWFKQLFSRRRLCNDLSEEIQAHLEEKIEEFVASGMPRKEAAAAARREFGNVTLTEQDRPRNLAVAVHRELSYGYSLRLADVAQISRFHCRGGIDACPWHWGEYGHLQLHQCFHDQAAALSAGGPAHDVR